MAENQQVKRALIQVEGLRKVYLLGKEKVVALNRIDLSIREGEICCIHGTSGSGKSTLLNLLAGLEKPSRGTITIGRHIITAMNEKQLTRFRQKYVGFIFQSYNLMDTMTAVENVALPLSFRGILRKRREKIAAAALRQVGLGERLTHKPTQMSGGQQQRVGIARAFVSKPRIIFADEPTGNLDTRTTVEIMRLMVRLALKNGQTLVIVSHDSEISDYADRVIHIVDGLVEKDYVNPAPRDREEILEEIRQAKEQKKDGEGRPIPPLSGNTCNCSTVIPVPSEKEIENETEALPVSGPSDTKE